MMMFKIAICSLAHVSTVSFPVSDRPYPTNHDQQTRPLAHLLPSFPAICDLRLIAAHDHL